MSIIINPYRYAAAGPTDPFYANVSSLLLFGDAPGTTSPADNKGVVWTRTAGTGSVSAANPKFGPGAYRFPDDTALDATAAGFAFGTGDFTIEEWVYFDSTGGVNDFPFAFGSNWGPYRNGSNLFLFDGASNLISATPGGLTNVYGFLSLSRVSGVFYMHWRGTLVGSVANATNFTGNNVRYGAQTTGAGIFKGDNGGARVTTGIGRYNGANYTEPTAAFPTS